MRKTRLLAALGAGLVAAAAATTFALAHGGDGTLIHACVGKPNGEMRIVAAAEDCRSSEYALDWNQKGEPGAPGAAGSAGPAGSKGADGADGAPGLEGPEGPAGRDGRDGRDGSSSGGGVVTPRGVGSITIDGQIQGQIRGGQAGTTRAMEIFEFHHEIVSPRDAASGQATGKRQHKPITFVKEWDASTPLLFQALTRNENLTTVVVTVDRPDGGGYIRIKLTNASVAGIARDTSAATDTLELETISLTYQKIEFEHVATGRVAEDDWETQSS
jgi:type VI secretion system secreted protein Hcp